MLTAPVLRRRLLTASWPVGDTTFARSSSHNARTKRQWRQNQAKKRLESEGKEWVDRRKGAGSERKTVETKQPSLIEQLFPEETRRYEEAQRKAAREIPRLPLETYTPVADRRQTREHEVRDASRSDTARRREEHMRREDALSSHTTVLVLRNASTNLVEEDFRRLIPQGKHMEGWTLEQGDIIKVIPGRDLATLKQQNYYYLLFSSKLSAFTYQGQATRISRMAASHTPSSMTSPIPPPPGYMVDGMDAHSALESFALVPASQNLDLRQLQPPLAPIMESIVRNQGYSALTRRSDRMPYEVRLTLEGPQLQLSSIRHILLATAKERSLAWSGGDEMIPKINKWEPKANVSPMDHVSEGARRIARANQRTEEEQMERDLEQQQKKQENEGEGMEIGRNGQKQMLRRTPGLVYIVGFYTEMAAQQFVTYWHRRPMMWKGEGAEKEWEDDLPPVTNVELLW